MIKTAIILAGGKGTRLRPITYEIPKSVLPIQGKAIVEHIFDLLKKYGINDIYLSVGYLKNEIIKYFGDGSKLGLNIKYIEEDEPLGTAGSLNLVKDKLNESFIVSNGDELKDIDIDNMLEFHKKNNATATIALTEVSNPTHYGVADIKDGKILRFVEKPKKEEAPSKLINSGFYILEPKVLDYIKQGFCMFEKDVFPKLAEEGNLYGYHFKGQWFDTGNFERFDIARREWKGIS